MCRDDISNPVSQPLMITLVMIVKHILCDRVPARQRSSGSNTPLLWSGQIAPRTHSNSVIVAEGECLHLSCESTTLDVRESNAATTQSLLEHAVLFLEILDHVQLLPVNPTREHQ